ncbi:MAG: protein kinase [Candidatus Obscuribacterales bacterium]
MVHLSEDSVTDLPSFGSRYRLESRIGAGGMGSVFRGWDQVLQKPVAIKMLLDDFASEAIIRFHQEAKTAAKLGHPNILNVLDFGQTSRGELYLVMDLLEGESLTDLGRRHNQVPPEIAIPIFIQICAGLQHAHSHDILHRDIKPSNIMLVRGDQGETLVKIVDFGLAKVRNEDQQLTTTGVRVGSPLYMSPEQCQGFEVDVRSDLYSLGCLMYKVLSGTTPFRSETLLETINKHIGEIPPHLSEVMEEDFPEALADLVMRLLEKDPDQRYQSAAEVSEELTSISEAYFDRLREEAAARNESIEVPVEAAAHLGLLSLKSGRTRMLGIGLLLGLAAIVGSVLIFQSVNRNESKAVSIKSPPMVVPVGNDYLNMPEDVGYFNHRSNESWFQALAIFSDKDMSYLKKGRGFERVSLSGSKVTGSGFSRLRDLSLKGLDISHTAVGDEALEEVMKGSTIESLFLDSSKVTDAGIASLADQRRLRVLSLRSLDISDDALAVLRELPALTFLNITGCKKLTGKGLEHLAGSRSLRVVVVTKCPGISSADISAFRKADSRCEVKTVDGSRGELESLYYARQRSQIMNDFNYNQSGGEKVREIQLYPRFAELKDDPEMVEFFKHPENLTNMKIIAAVKNPKVKSLLEDPVFQKQMKKPETMQWIKRKTKEGANWWEEDETKIDTTIILGPEGL